MVQCYCIKCTWADGAAVSWWWREWVRTERCGTAHNTAVHGWWHWIMHACMGIYTVGSATAMHSCIVNNSLVSRLPTHGEGRGMGTRLIETHTFLPMVKVVQEWHWYRHGHTHWSSTSVPHCSHHRQNKVQHKYPPCPWAGEGRPGLVDLWIERTCEQMNTQQVQYIQNQLHAPKGPCTHAQGAYHA